MLVLGGLLGEDAREEPTDDASTGSEASTSGENTASPTTTAATTTTLATTTEPPTTTASPTNTEAPEVVTTTTPEPTTQLPTTTAARQEDDSVPIVPGAVEQTESDSSGSDLSVEVTAGSEGAVAELLGRLEALPVQPEQRSGYDRDLFDHWVDVDGDGCDARREVLIAEAIEVPRVGSSCSLSGGRWYSRYDGATATGTGSNFDVDHLVPLAEAWDSGAHGWDSDTRRRYANDLGYAHSLVAVSASSNRQKGAADPAEWLPPEISVRCWYAEAWISVKTRWELSVDAGELRALRALVAQCEDRQLGGAAAPASPVSAPATTEPPQTTAPPDVEVGTDDSCHPAYIPCLPNLPGDAMNCGDLSSAQKPVQVRTIGVDPYRLDRDRDGRGCES